MCRFSGSNVLEAPQCVSWPTCGVMPTVPWCVCWGLACAGVWSPFGVFRVLHDCGGSCLLLSLMKVNLDCLGR
jgi:hypothetical protein